jgi:putative phage-type endonuclease
MILQRTPEWHAARIGRVTGSVAGAILGLSPYQTRADVMRAMVRAAKGAPSEFTGNVATEWGTANEAGAVVEFEMETSERVDPMPFVTCDDWLGASPDGMVSDGRGLEVKCPYGLRNEPNPVFKPLNDQPHYHAQMQIEMYCCGWDSLWFYQWAPHGTYLKLIHRDDDWLNANLPVLRQFHAEYLYELANNADEHLAPRRIEIDTPEAMRMVQEWDQLAEAMELAEARKKDLLAEMVALACDRDAVFAGRKLTKVAKAGSISYAKALKILAPDADLEPWRRKASSYWKVS